MKKNTFVTIFPTLENIHLHKDVGMIPYFLTLNHKIESSIVSYKVEKEYPAIQELDPLKLVFIKRLLSFKNTELSILLFLLKKARKTDILNLYHISFSSMLYGWFYKFLNSKGILYIKLDIELDNLKKNNGISERHSRNFVKRLLYNLFFNKVDILSVETKDCDTFMRIKYPDLNNKLILIPNGFNYELITKNKIKIREFDQKENIILNVGRLGSYQKNTEMVLELAKKINLGDWKIILIGKLEDGFDITVEDFFKENPHLLNKVIFTGNISKVELFDYYNRAKIFVFTSRYESFGIALLEALAFGIYTISTFFPSANDITLNGKYGVLVPQNDIDQMVLEVFKAMSNSTVILDNYNKSLNYIKTNFDWSNIVYSLNQKFIQLNDGV